MAEKAVVARVAAGRAEAGRAEAEEVKDLAGAVVAILAEVAAARARVAVVILVGAAVVAAGGKAPAVAAVVIQAAAVAAVAAEAPAVIQAVAAVEGAKAPAAAAHLVVEVAATPEAPVAVQVAVRVAGGARARVEARVVVAVAEDREAATAGVLVAEAIGSFKGSGGCRLPAGPSLPYQHHRTILLHVDLCHPPPPGLHGGEGYGVHWQGSHHNLEALVSTPRGRQARLRTKHASLYPGLKPGVWMPVEKLLSLVTDLIHKDRSKSGIITGRRLLHDEHFEYRGTSARPKGLPASHSRLSDSSAEPSPANESSGPLGRAG